MTGIGKGSSLGRIAARWQSWERQIGSSPLLDSCRENSTLGKGTRNLLARDERCLEMTGTDPVHRMIINREVSGHAEISARTRRLRPHAFCCGMARQRGARRSEVFTFRVLRVALTQRSKSRRAPDMATPTKRCRVHYRRLRRDGASLPSGSFSKLISDALHSNVDGVALKDKVDLRIMPPSPDSSARRVINDLHFFGDHVFGNACSFTPGQMQALLKTAAEQPSHGSLQEALARYDIDEAKAGAGREYVGGICYWLAIDDHFYQIQHVSLQAKQMEEYFGWLLRERTNVLGAGGFVELLCEFDRQQVGGDLDEISSIEIGGIAPETAFRPSTDTPDMPRVEEVETTESVGSMAAHFERAKKVLTALLGPAGTREIMDKMPVEAALEVKVNIGYKSRRRKLNKEFMGDIASGLRNLPDGEMRVRGKGGEMRGTDVRLSEDMSVNKLSDESGLLDLEHALEQMLEVHRRFLHDGKIQSGPHS